MREGQRIALIGVAVSAGLSTLKILVGWFSGSSAVLADGFESAGDVLSSGLVWLGLTLAAKPADSNHPYGHGRAETISGLVVGLLLFCGGCAIAVIALINARDATLVPAIYAVYPLFISIALKAIMVRLKWVTARKIGSSALAADSMNDSVDMLSGVIALGALGLTLYDPAHFLRADHYGAAAVGAIMVGTGIRVARRTGTELMDTMPEDSFVDTVREVALQIPGVQGVEKVFARKTGLQHHVDLHLQVDPTMTVRVSHYLGHQVEDRLLACMHNIADVLVHIEPSPGASNSLSPKVSRPRLLDTTHTVDDLPILPDPGGQLRLYFEGRTDMLLEMVAGSLVLAPGTSPHPPHQHPEEEFMLVAEGTGEILCGEQLKAAGPGTMMYCAGNKLHGITNTGPTPMTFYFYKWLA